MFHNGSIYDYHFIIKDLARKFEGNFECFGENSEKYISFTVPFKKVINDKKSKYKIRISDSYKFMKDSLSNLVDNLSEFKVNKIDNDVLIKQFYNTYQLSDNDINKFKSLLRKVHILMNIWIVGKDLVKQSYRQKTSFIVNQILKIFQLMIMRIQLMYGTLLILVISVNIMIYMLN